MSWFGTNQSASFPNNPTGSISASSRRLDLPWIGVPQRGQNVRVKVAPDAACRLKLEVSPVTVTASESKIATAECPVPVAFWQSSHEQRNME